MNVKIKLLDGGKMPVKGSAGACAFDCYASKTVVVEDEAVLIPLGFSLELPNGYCAKVLPRSSTGLKTPLRMPNSFGLIDSDYRGQVFAEYECKKPYSYVIREGERICQMLIEKVESIELIEVDELNDTERGNGGFGSTEK